MGASMIWDVVYQVSFSPDNKILKMIFILAGILLGMSILLQVDWNS